MLLYSTVRGAFFPNGVVQCDATLERSVPCDLGVEVLTEWIAWQM